ncbi:DUF4760 domain-containing protein [Streptomyces collinus]|uniref:DUF4760 domain-containing protein n=1 Tax=Streptomyces collinus TaxID=42684 RepID=UPI0033242F8A
MDLSLSLNLASLVIALTALGVSVFLARQQIRLATGGNHLPVVLNSFKETRSQEFFEAHEFVLSVLPVEHQAELGYRQLPEPAKTHVRTVGLFYDDLGKLVAHDVISERLVIGSYGTAITRAWEALGPYVYRERERNRSNFWVYLEDLAARIDALPSRVVHAELGLKKLPPVNPPGP